ncbi:MAG: glycosyltransferase family 4 protein [archaeon]
MKKLLIATDGFLPRWDGISSFLNEMIPRLKEDYEVTVIAPNLGELKINYGVKIIRFDIHKLRLGDNYYPCKIKWKILAREIEATDAVFAQCLGPIGAAAITVAKFKKKPSMLYNHMLEWEVFAKSQKGDIMKVPINSAMKLVGKKLYNMCSLILVSSLEHSDLLTLTGVKSRKMVVHLGVDTRLYKPPASKAVAKDNLGLDHMKLVIGYGGRVSYEKDPKTLYRAFRRLAKRHKDVLLLIAGGGHPDLERMFSGRNNIIISGLKDNLAPYYQAMDIYVLPSLIETTSLTTMEAMATGCAVVATPVGFVKEYINDGVNGLLFPKKNTFVLYQKLDYLIKNPDIREKLGRNARETMVEKYDWSNTYEGIKKALSELMPIKNS